ARFWMRTFFTPVRRACRRAYDSRLSRRTRSASLFRNAVLPARFLHVLSQYLRRPRRTIHRRHFLSAHSRRRSCTATRRSTTTVQKRCSGGPPSIGTRSRPPYSRAAPVRVALVGTLRLPS